MRFGLCCGPRQQIQDRSPATQTEPLPGQPPTVPSGPPLQQSNAARAGRSAASRGIASMAPRQPAPFVRPHGPLPEAHKNNLKPGTVLLYAPYQGKSEPLSEKAHGVNGEIVDRQTAMYRERPQSFKGGDPRVTHAAMWLKAPGAPSQEPEIGQAVLPGVGATSLTSGTWEAWEPVNGRVGEAAAETMKTWAADRNIPYSIPRAREIDDTVVRLGPGTSQEIAASAESVRADAATNTPAFASEGTSCAEVVTQALHAGAMVAGAGNESLVPILPSRASPMGLQAALASNPAFQPVGVVQV